MKKLKEKRGVTLIALVVTIIILLILAGMTMIMLTGENSILHRAEESKKVTDKEEVRERVELEALDCYDKNGFNMEKFKENIEKNLGVNAGSEIETEDGGLSFLVDGYMVNVKKREKGGVEVELEGDGKKENLPIPPDLQKSDTKITFEPTSWTNEKVTVTIKTDIDKGTSILQYSIDKGQNWKKYTDPFEVTENNTTILARLWNGANEGGYATAKITKIDKNEPKEGEIKYNKETLLANIGEIIEATVTLSDDDTKDGESGIDIEKCKWTYNDNSENIGTDENSYENKIDFTEADIEQEGEEGDKIVKTATKKLELKEETEGTYYLHILIVDKAGNKKEKVGDAIEVKQLVTGVTLNKTSVQLKRGSSNPTDSIVATLQPANANTEGTTITWSSNNPSYVSVDQNGTITGLKRADSPVTIKAEVTTLNGKYEATCDVTVVQYVTGITLNKTTSQLKRGSTNPTDSIVATLEPTDATEGKTITWSSNNPSYVSVNQNGGITGLQRADTAVAIKAEVTTLEGKREATCNVTVVQLVTSITVGAKAVAINGSKNLTVTVNPSNANNKTLTWTTTNSGTVAVNASTRTNNRKSGRKCSY